MLPRRKLVYRTALEELRKAYEKMIYDEEVMDPEDAEAYERLVKLCRNITCVAERKKDGNET